MTISKQKEMFNNFADERNKEITDLDVNVDSNNLIYGCKGNTTDAKCDEFDNAFNLLDKIRKGKIKLADVKDGQTKFKSNLGE